MTSEFPVDLFSNKKIVGREERRSRSSSNSLACQESRHDRACGQFGHGWRLFISPAPGDREHAASPSFGAKNRRTGRVYYFYAARPARESRNQAELLGIPVPGLASRGGAPSSSPSDADAGRRT